MKKLFIYIAFGVMFGCAGTDVPIPKYATPEGETCGAACRDDYAECMKLEVRPDYLLFSPRKHACEKMLRECYGKCLEKEQKPLSGWQSSVGPFCFYGGVRLNQPAAEGNGQ